MAALDDLTTAKTNIAAQLADMTANPKPSYSVAGRSVSWDEHFRALTEMYEKLMNLIALEGAPYEVGTMVIT